MRLIQTPWLLAVSLAAVLAVPGALLAVQTGPLAEGEGPDAAAVAAAFGAPVRVANTDGFEPSVRVDSTGVVYVAFARGLPNPSWLVVSEDNGATWTKAPSPPLLRGAEPEIALGDDDTLYFSDLWVGNTVLATYTDKGRKVSSFTAIGQTTTGVDRQWIVMGEGSEMWLNTNDVQRGMYQYYTPDANTVPTTAGRPITNLPHFSSPPAYDRNTGYVYTLYDCLSYFPSGGQGVCVARTERPTEAGIAPGLGVIPLRFRVADPVDNFGLFPVAAVDEAGNVYAVWADSAGDGGHAIYLAWSTDHGQTWAAPVRVSETPGSAVFPWIAAGGPGRVAIAWLGSDEAAFPEAVSADAEWQVRFAQSIDVLSGSPTFTETRATGTVHQGGVCVSGTACGVSPPWTVDRDLGDYIQIALGPDGMAHIAYTDDFIVQDPQIYHVRQTSGTPT